MKSSFYKIFIPILLGALIILVSLPFISRTPTPKAEEIEVKKASLLIEQGKVMEGVTMLKGILDKDENNLEAIWELGKLSLQSEQYDKAIGRFEKFVSLTKDKEKISGLIYLSDAYFFSGDKQKSLENLTMALDMNEDSEIELEIQERINIINQN